MDLSCCMSIVSVNMALLSLSGCRLVSCLSALCRLRSLTCATLRWKSSLVFVVGSLRNVPTALVSSRAV